MTERRKQQPRSQVTKQRVLAAAIAEFAECGPDGARIESIAARAGVNKQALYYHYGSKDVLYRAALASVYEKGRIDPAQWRHTEGSPTDVMRRLIRAVFEEVRSNEEDTALITHENRQHGTHLQAELRKRIQRGVLPIRTAIRHVLKRGQREGAFGKHVDPDRLYLTIVALSMFYFSHAYTLSAILERDLLETRNVSLWQNHVEVFVLNGMLPR